MRATSCHRRRPMRVSTSADTWSSISHGRRCCAASGAIRTATARRTGRSSPARAGTSPATALATTPTGAIWILGRIDDVMNVSGHRISTAEVESALVGHSGVAEAAVVGATDKTTGQAICAFVVLQASHAQTTGAEIIDELRAEVARVISPIARPRELHVVPELPKTRSGKIMRRLLRDIAEKRELGDTSTLLDPGVFDAIRAAQ